MGFNKGILLLIGAQICMAISKMAHPCSCTKDYRPVCGTDGITYANPCVLNCAAYRSGEDITVAYDGPCERSEACPAIYAPVCGSDGVTYSNTCTFDYAKESMPDLTIVKQGPCNEDENSIE